MISNYALQRTLRIKYKENVATCFTIDVDARQFLVTARHVIPSVEDNVRIEIYHESRWKTVPCKVVGYTDDEVDIIVLAPAEQLTPKHPLLPTVDGLILGQDVYFLGFPYNLHLELYDANLYLPMPLVKKACVSLLSFGQGEPRRMLLDGHNNRGFSGGPVLFYPNGDSSGDIRVAGVISGFVSTSEKVFYQENATPLHYIYNTGIIRAFPIIYALEIIHDNPL